MSVRKRKEIKDTTNTADERDESPDRELMRKFIAHRRDRKWSIGLIFVCLVALLTRTWKIHSPPNVV